MGNKFFKFKVVSNNIVLDSGVTIVRSSETANHARSSFNSSIGDRVSAYNVGNEVYGVHYKLDNEVYVIAGVELLDTTIKPLVGKNTKGVGMHATGIVRGVDDCNRLVIPKELRKCNSNYAVNETYGFEIISGTILLTPSGNDVQLDEHGRLTVSSSTLESFGMDVNNAAFEFYTSFKGCILLTPCKIRFEDSTKETKKAFEERLLSELIVELDGESLRTILIYAAEYLRGNKCRTVRPVDLKRASILDKYSNKLATRISEPRR